MERLRILLNQMVSEKTADVFLNEIRNRPPALLVKLVQERESLNSLLNQIGISPGLDRVGVITALEIWSKEYVKKEQGSLAIEKEEEQGSMAIEKEEEQGPLAIEKEEEQGSMAIIEKEEEKSLGTDVKTISPNEWTSLEVKQWIKEKGFDKFVDNFDYSNGETLLSYGVDDLLKLKIPENAAVPLAKFIKALNPPKPQVDTLRSSKKPRLESFQEKMKSQEWQSYVLDPQRNWIYLPVNAFSHYEDIRMGCYYFKDITPIIDLFHFRNEKVYALFRPPRFGKTLLLSVLQEYYDINSAMKFNFLFQGTAAEKSEVPHNQNFVMKLNFSDISTLSDASILETLSFSLKHSLQKFYNAYSKNFSKYSFDPNAPPLDEFSRLLEEIPSTNYSLCILIDEYDAPLNNLSDGLRNTERNKTLGWLKQFYSKIKQYRQDNCINFVLLVGVLPMALADLSKDFNIVVNLTFDSMFSNVLGLNSEDVQKPLEKIVPDQQKRAVFFKHLKKIYNGFRFVASGDVIISGLFCTNLVIEALQYLKLNGRLLDRSEHSEVNQTILTYMAKTNSGKNLLQLILANGVAYYDIKRAPQFKLIDLNLDDATWQCTTILLHIGALTFPAKENCSNQLCITNPSAKRVLSKVYLLNIPDYDDEVELFLAKGDIGPLLTYMESQGVYKSEKPETFSQQNELAPQSIFVALLNTKHFTTTFEKYIQCGNSNVWIDAVSAHTNIIQVTEWKNIKLDFLLVPGAPNNSHLSQEQCLAKVRILRKMKKEDVMLLKTTQFDLFYPNQTMYEIIQETFATQARVYANTIQEKNPDFKIFVHVALSVGTSWILHQTWDI